MALIVGMARADKSRDYQGLPPQKYRIASLPTLPCPRPESRSSIDRTHTISLRVDYQVTEFKCQGGFQPAQATSTGRRAINDTVPRGVHGYLRHPTQYDKRWLCDRVTWWGYDRIPHSHVSSYNKLRDVDVCRVDRPGQFINAPSERISGGTKRESGV